MAFTALPWRWLVEDHLLFIYEFAHLVTAVTSYISMRARKRKRRALVMVELRWFPTGSAVAAGTIDRISARQELPGMLIFVASGALCRGSLKIYILQVGF